ncbi:MAG: hypothetical protein ACOY4K_12190 [Pseudomonadota bacterium]
MLAGLAGWAGPAAADAADSPAPRFLYLPQLRSVQEKADADIKAAGQSLATWLAFVGDEPGAFAAMVANNVAWRAGRPPRPAAVDLAGATATDAIEAIVRASRGRRIVILNEAHHVSACRQFAADVARALRAEGFDWLAAETFASRPDARFAKRANGEGPIDADLGYYLWDPVFAQFAREARSAGFTLAAYEQRADQEAPPEADRAARIGAREDAQAANLIAAVLAGNPDARLLVYCGYSHVAKSPLGGLSWMAARLKAMTGVDPLCIEQSGGMAGADTDADAEAVVAHFSPARPLAAFRADGGALTGRYPGAVDIAVYHPMPGVIEGRPRWLATAAGRRRAAFALGASAPVGGLLQAIPAADVARTARAIPADQYLVKTPADAAVFFLRPGAYDVCIETDDGRRRLGSLSVR